MRSVAVLLPSSGVPPLIALAFALKDLERLVAAVFFPPDAEQTLATAGHDTFIVRPWPEVILLGHLVD